MFYPPSDWFYTYYYYWYNRPDDDSYEGSNSTVKPSGKLSNPAAKAISKKASAKKTQPSVRKSPADDSDSLVAEPIAEPYNQTVISPMPIWHNPNET